MHRGYTDRALIIIDDANFVAQVLHQPRIRVEDISIALLRNLDLPGAQILMDQYPGIDLLEMARGISNMPIIDKIEKKSDIKRLPQTKDSNFIMDRVLDYSKKLHHDSYASVHFPYAITLWLNSPPTQANGSPEGVRVRAMFDNEGKKWPSGPGSLDSIEASTTTWLNNHRLPVYGTVSQVPGQDLFEYEKVH